ncbi:polysaccharide biosynthesis C-terminal domain-containing protein [bacterium]|nr:polysaccharide biosynthesis C-terminal domain-containing protein [bacterium]
MNRASTSTENSPIDSSKAETLSRQKMVHEGLLVTLLTVLTKLTGFARELVLAFYFGTTIVVDSLRVAVDISFHVWGVIAGNVIEHSMIPILVKWRTRGAHRSVAYLLRVTAWFGLALSLLAMVVIWYYSPKIAMLQAPSFPPEKMIVVSEMIRWIAPSVPLFVACNLLGYLLISVQKLRVFSMLAVFQNFGLILGAVLVGLQVFPPYWMSVFYVFSMIVALVFLVVDAKKFLPGKVRFTWKRTRVILFPFIASLTPLLILALVTQMRLFIDKRIASDLVIGAVSALWYTRFVVTAPTQTAGLAITRLILPHFSAMIQKQEADQVGRQYLILLELSLWMLLPLVLLVASCSEQLVTVIFARGAFQEKSIGLTTIALIGASPGLWVLMINPLTNRIFNAQGRNILLMIVGSLTILMNIVLAYVLSDPNGVALGVAGVAFANVIAQFTMTFILLWFLPGNVTFKSILIIFKWFAGAAIIFGMLTMLPDIENNWLHIMVVALIILLGWSGLTLILPGGRDSFKRLMKSVQRSKGGS